MLFFLYLCVFSVYLCITLLRTYTEVHRVPIAIGITEVRKEVE
jgi:hypothetical protein